MIRNTFQHIPGIGPWRERDLWARGIADWNAFSPPAGEVLVSSEVDERARARIAEAKGALARRDLTALARLFPPREHWRLYGAFSDEAVFFDIETDGRDTLRPTVVSLFGCRGLEVFIAGRNLDDLPASLAQSQLWVTFNGRCFDVPVLERHFGAHFPRPAVHVDLRFVARKLKLGSGLKALEEKLGIARPPHLRGVNGYDAVLLWRAYQTRGELAALRFLVEYNLYDAFQLRGVFDRLYNEAVRRLAVDAERLPEFERGEVLYDVSRLLLQLGPTEHDEVLLERLRAAEEVSPP